MQIYTCLLLAFTRLCFCENRKNRPPFIRHVKCAFGIRHHDVTKQRKHAERQQRTTLNVSYCLHKTQSCYKSVSTLSQQFRFPWIEENWEAMLTNFKAQERYIPLSFSHRCEMKWKGGGDKNKNKLPTRNCPNHDSPLGTTKNAFRVRFSLPLTKKRRRQKSRS